MGLNKELLKGSTVILVLTLLEREPMYGYQMIAAMDHHSGGVFRFKEGTIYPILHALESEGYLIADWSQGEGERKRKYYKITNRGRDHLQALRAEWVTFRTAVDRVIGEVQA
jgi:PadR family transcriptional regulator PadR